MKYIIANWKANQNAAGGSEFIAQLSAELTAQPLSSEVQLIVCPTSVFYVQYNAQKDYLPFALGLQDISAYEGGAHTGEVTRSNLEGIEPAYAIVGHSERRRDQGETAEVIAAKLAQLRAMKTVPILCFDEPELPALIASLQDFRLQDFPLILAYEPVTAISTSGSAGNLDAVLVRERLQEYRQRFAGFSTDQWSFVYGGSVKPENAASYAGVCDGLLIGSASLQAESFLAIARAFSHDKRD